MAAVLQEMLQAILTAASQQQLISRLENFVDDHSPQK